MSFSRLEASWASRYRAISDLLSNNKSFSFAMVLTACACAMFMDVHMCERGLRNVTYVNLKLFEHHRSLSGLMLSGYVAVCGKEWRHY